MVLNTIEDYMSEQLGMSADQIEEAIAKAGELK